MLTQFHPNSLVPRLTSACFGFGTVGTFFEKTLKKSANCTKRVNAGVKAT